MRKEETPIPMADHAILEAEMVAEHYITGRLSPEEAARFEEHYFDCPECCARIEAATSLRRGLARLAEEEAGAAARRFRPTPAWGLAAAALLAVALLPASWELQQAGRLRAELHTARAVLVRERAGRPPAGDLTRLTQRVEALDAELRQARGDLAAAEERRDTLGRELAAGRQPFWDVPILALTPLRGGSGDGPVRTLALPRTPGWVALWIEPGGSEYAAYRITLLDARGTAVFSAPRSAENDLGALLVALHSTSLAPGTYRLTVDGLGDGGAPPVPVARFPLRVVAPG